MKVYCCLCLLQLSDLAEDELQNVEMAEDERAKKNTELKTKKRDYTGYDDDEFKDGQAGMRRSILSKYDEELEGSGETASRDVLIFWASIDEFTQGFRLGGASSSKAALKAKRELDPSSSSVSVNKQLLSLDYESKACDPAFRISADFFSCRKHGDFRLSSGRGRWV